MSFLNSILFALNLAGLSLLIALVTGYYLFGSSYLRFIERLVKGKNNNNNDDDDGPGGGLLQPVQVSF